MHIEARIPILPSKIAEYCRLKLSGESVRFKLDLDQTTFSEDFVIDYVSHTKAPCHLNNFNERHLFYYMFTDKYLQLSNLMHHHANILYYSEFGECYYHDSLGDFDVKEIEKFVSKYAYNIERQMAVLRSLPLYLLKCSGQSVEFQNKVEQGKQENCGVNFCNLILDDEFLVRLLSKELFNFQRQTYFAKHFDENIYDDQPLISFFMSQPSNLLLKIPGSV